MIERIAVLGGLLALGACGHNDDQISQAVQARLNAEGVADQVQVSTLRRVVVLQGVVNDPNELNRAELAARSVPGIMGIDNRIVVKTTVQTTGADLEERR